MGATARHDAAMTASFAAHVQKRWRFVVLQAAVAVVIVTAILAVRGEASSSMTVHFVLHPEPNATIGDVNNSLDVLTQDGPLTQTVLKVLSSGEMVKRASDAAQVKDASAYTITATVAPGSNYFDVTLAGPERAVTAELARTLPLVASAYVQASYHGFDFDVVGDVESTTHRSFPPSSAVLILAFVLGAVAAIAELFVQFAAQRLRAFAPTPSRSGTNVARVSRPVDGERNGFVNSRGPPPDVAGVTRPFDAERDGFVVRDGASPDTRRTRRHSALGERGP
jgi:hypothetical protein